jgi:translocation and assembly module TamB
VAFSDKAFSGALTATLDVSHFPLATPRYGRASLVLEALHLARGGLSADLVEKTKPIELAGDRFTADTFKLRLSSRSGSSAIIALGGSASHVTTAPTLDLHLGLDPVDLARLGADVPSVERASGTLTAEVGIVGPVAAPRFAGALTLHKGELQLKGFPVGLSDAEVAIAVADGDAQLTKAEARVGGGTLRVTGRMPLRGPEAGAFTANVEARGVKVPVQDGVSLTADAKLEALYRFALLGQQRSVPDVKGTVELTQFSYTRPMGLNIALSQLGRPSRTNVETYDPDNDIVHFNVNLVSPKPLRVANNLVEGDVEIASPGLVLSGTNQRFGARGMLRIMPDSKVQFRSNEFLVKEGQVRFDDPMKIAPIFDVRAQTEYRRYASSAEPAAAGAASTGDASGTSGAAASPVSAAASTSAAGVWRITLQARGETDNLKVTLNSDPPLSQEDIVLLLTLGMTRAELDRGATAAFGQGLGLEALSALTGADKAVKTVVPLIDDFRFGTGYSSKTASPEPTVTVGKRVTENVRASVTTGLSEDREVRSNVEWRLNRNVSVQGSYDNLTDVSNSPVGNLGVDLRWRLEFE